MSNYFNPEDVIIAQGVVSNITRNGAGFISTKEGEDVFVPVRLVETSRIEMGDSVTVYMVKNFGDSIVKSVNDTVPYRALRVTINSRLGVDLLDLLTAPVDPVQPPVLPSVPEVSEAIVVAKPKMGSAMLRTAVDRVFASGFIGTSAMIHAELVRDFPDIDMTHDDGGLRVKMDISSLLHRMHDDGLIAQARICNTGDQKNSSYSVYGTTAKGLFSAIIGA
jgi:cold shock CspA family protein